MEIHRPPFAKLNHFIRLWLLECLSWVKLDLVFEFEILRPFYCESPIMVTVTSPVRSFKWTMGVGGLRVQFGIIGNCTIPEASPTKKLCRRGFWRHTLYRQPGLPLLAAAGHAAVIIFGGKL